MHAATPFCRRPLPALFVIGSLVLLASFWYLWAPDAECQCADEERPTESPRVIGSTQGRELVTLVVVTCAGSLELTMANLKSAVAFSRAPLRLILYADEENIKLLQDRIIQWPASVLARITYDLRLVMFPRKDYDKWNKLFKPCATQRLFLPDMLPMEDAVLYVDADALFLNPVENIWEVFEKMNDSHLMALVHEIEDEANNWYKLEAKHPFVPPFGVNAGVMAMNLTRMRNFHWVSRMGPLLGEYEDRIFLGDQDLVNIMFSAHPDKLFLMTCRWNYRQENCVFHSSCSGETPALVHGSRNCFTDPDREPSIYAVYSVMQKYELGTSLEREFIDPLERELHRVRQSECVVQLLFHAKQWRILARQLDSERGFNDDATNAAPPSTTST
ncbi:glucoside xylosyltransferase 1-like [Ixodes scapularis]|uniref:glucoside xylosyltransferase 1-like n=1 Tax=Ixodes scapularis TaxID=6945 RepID=UPI001C38D70D|nr:glucoside xylosyltransferase 1-like [Ixodes scapularis]